MQKNCTFEMLCPSPPVRQNTKWLFKKFCPTLCVQTPVLFAGSIRMNLDPLGEKMDSELWAALRRWETVLDMAYWGQHSTRAACVLLRALALV